MADVINGRQTATVDDDVVVFIIGMRFNRLSAAADLAAGLPGDAQDAAGAGERGRSSGCSSTARTGRVGCS